MFSLTDSLEFYLRTAKDYSALYRQRPANHPLYNDPYASAVPPHLQTNPTYGPPPNYIRPPSSQLAGQPSLIDADFYPPYM